MQGRSLVSAPVRFHDNLDILIERDEKAQQAFNRKLPEFAAQHFRDIGLLDAKKIGRLDLFQAAMLQYAVDLENELRFDQVLFGIRQAEVRENIPASGFVCFLPHSSFSFAIRSASRRRRFINSMSMRGVSRPLFDFFWKA
jgi:hypothetical protein